MRYVLSFLSIWLVRATSASFIAIIVVTAIGMTFFKIVTAISFIRPARLRSQAGETITDNKGMAALRWQQTWEANDANDGYA